MKPQRSSDTALSEDVIFLPETSPALSPPIFRTTTSLKELCGTKSVLVSIGGDLAPRA